MPDFVRVIEVSRPGRCISLYNIDSMISLETIRDMIRRLPGAGEGKSYGTPGFKVKKKLFARLHQKEDAVVVLLNSVEEQRALIRKDPAIYYITDHYKGYPAVLVRRIVDEDELFDVLEHAWRRVARRSDIAEYDARRT